MEITAPLRIEELRAGWAAREAGTPRLFASVTVGAKTDLGRARENNEDKYEYLEPDDPGVLALKGRFYAVADGMGGHSAGQIASEVALNTAFRAYYNDSSADVEASLARALQEANAYLLDVARTIPGRSGMGTTFTGGVVREDDLIVVHVGDSRLYRLSAGSIEQLTEDHSWVAEQVRMGSMTEAEANASPFRNVITRSLGAAPDLEPDLFRVKLRPGDRFIFCSDGLNGMVADDEILRWGSSGSPSVAAWNLVELANQYGGKDNITVLVLAVKEIQPWQTTGDPADASTVAEEIETRKQGDTEKETDERGESLRASSSVPPCLRVSDPSTRPPRRSVAAWMRGLLGRA